MSGPGAVLLFLLETLSWMFAQNYIPQKKEVCVRKALHKYIMYFDYYGQSQLKENNAGKLKDLMGITTPHIPV